MALQYLFLFRILKKFTSPSKVFQQGFSLSQKLPVFLHNVTSSEKPFLPTLSKIVPYLQPITLSFTFFITHHYLKLYYKLPTTECLIRSTRGTPPRQEPLSVLFSAEHPASCRSLCTSFLSSNFLPAVHILAPSYASCHSSNIIFSGRDCPDQSPCLKLVSLNYCLFPSGPSVAIN